VAKKHKPKTQLLLRCKCTALYNPRLRWQLGFYSDPCSTTNQHFVRTGMVAAGHCPVCRRPPVGLERVSAVPMRQTM
jgi:hypothetical protein